MAEDVMADSISYTPTTWADGADGGTPITAARLNNIERGINNATKQVNANTKGIKALGDSVSQYLHIEVVMLDAPSSVRAKSSNLGTVTAPAVSGYKFVMWVMFSTSGWIGACYPENTMNATTSVWCAADKNSSMEGVVKGYALYVKNV